MREGVVSGVFNVVFFAVWVGVPTVAPEAEQFLPKAFGPRPFGFPVQRVVFCVLTLLYLPFVPAVCGLMRLTFLKAEMVGAAQREDWDRYGLLAEQRPAARRLVWFGFGYLVAIAAGWTLWAGLHGL